MSDWVAAKDPDSGATYYHNTQTDETAWEKPDGFVEPESEETAADGGEAEWVEATDPDSGATYYHNTKTDETSWEVPPGYTPAAKAAPAEDAAAGGADSEWVEATDPDSGATYYHNTKTDETSWEVPPGYTPKQDAGADSAAAAAAPAPAPAVASTAAAPAPAAAAPPVAGAGLGLNTDDAAADSASNLLGAESKALWKQLLDNLKDHASKELARQNKKFVNLKNFAQLTLKRKQEAAAKAKAAGSAAGAGAGAEAGAGAGDAASGSTEKTVWSFLSVDVEEPPEKSIEEYAENYFNLNRKGFLGKKTTVEKIMSWKSDIIKMALKKMPSKDLNSQATQCFRNITGFMGDRNTKKEVGGHAEKLLKACLNAPEELRDEVYCQLIKQTTNNPKPDSLIKGWQLMGICTGAFPPSKSFEPYLLSFFNSHKNDSGGVGAYATFCAGRVKMATKLGPRREVPTAMEIDACKNMQPVALRVYHLDGTFEIMPCVSWTTSAHMNEMMAFKLGIKNAEAFACYEITPDGEERYLEPEERLLDMVAYWQRLFEEEKSKATSDKKSVINMYRVAYKVHMYFEPDKGDTAAKNQMYIQTVYDVVSSRYPCTEKDCLQLAAYQLQKEYGDAGVGGLNEEKKLKRFLPASYVADEAKRDEYVAAVMRNHEILRGRATEDVKDLYLSYVKKWKIFGSSIFFVVPQMSVELPEEVFLAVNPKGVLIINPDTKEILAEHPYSEVPTWGHSGTSFVLHVGNLIRQTKLYFQTEQGKEINDLVRAYVNHLCVA